LPVTQWPFFNGLFPWKFPARSPYSNGKRSAQDLAAEALSQDTERLEIDITLGAGAVDPQPSIPAMTTGNLH
jgi:hypothetical protein